MQHTDIPLTDLATLAALERLASDAEGPRWANAYRRAADHYRAGVRPIALPEKWLVPSASTAGVWYEVARRGDRCACKAGASGCWHAALAIGVELSYEYLDAGLVGDDEPTPADDTPPPAAGSHDYYTQIAERRQAAGLDCCGRSLHARDSRPLSLGQRIARQRARVADVRGDW